MRASRLARNAVVSQSSITINETVTATANTTTTITGVFAQAPSVNETIVACITSAESDNWGGPGTGPAFTVVTQSGVQGTAAILAATGDGSTTSFTFTNSSGANLLTAQDSEFESAGVGTWASMTNCSLANNGSNAHTGTHSLAMTPTVNGSDVSAGTVQYAVTPLTSYTASGFSKSASTARYFAMNIQWQTSAHTFISNSNGASTLDTSASFTTAGTVTGNSPSNAAYGFPYAFWGAPSEVHYLDTVSMSGGAVSEGIGLVLMRVSGLGGPGAFELTNSVSSSTSASSAVFTPGTSTQANELWVACLSPVNNTSWTPSGLSYSGGFTSTLLTAAGASRWDAAMVGTKVVSATGSAATTAGWTNAASRYGGVFAAFTPTATNTATLTVAGVLDSMNKPHDYHPDGLPSGYSWYNHPEVPNATDPGQPLLTAWAQVYRAAGTSVAANVGVEVGNFYSAIWSNSQQKWFIVQAQKTVDGNYYIEDFYNNLNTAVPWNPHFTPTSGAIYAEMTTATYSSVYGGSDPTSGSLGANEGFNLHFWPHTGQVNITNATGVALADIGAYFAAYQARLILSDPLGADNRASATYEANCGGDWWAANFSSNPEIVQGRLKVLTNNWQPICCYTGGPYSSAPAWTEAQLTANPPPLNYMGYLTGS